MTLFQALILAVIQGLTEFLPVSSSGHLVIFQKIFGFDEPPVFFDILLHVGSLGAILVFFKDKILAVLRDGRLVFLLGLATLPSCFLAIFLEGLVNQIFNSLWLTGFFYLVMALILFRTCESRRFAARKQARKKPTPEIRQLADPASLPCRQAGVPGEASFSTRFLQRSSQRENKLSWVDSLTVGVFQALAIFPGISRSGSTIAAGLWRGMGPEVAFDFSFLLGVVAIIGAFVFKLSDLGGFSSLELSRGILAMLVAGGLGYFSLKTLKDLVERKKLFWFGFYCLFLGLTVLSWECIFSHF